MNYPPLINTVKKKSDDNPVKIVLVVPEHLPKLYDKYLLNISGGNIIKTKDNRHSIFSKIKGANALIGCPRSIFDDDLLNHSFIEYLIENYHICYAQSASTWYATKQRDYGKRKKDLLEN